jgi:hypothetical protein
MAAPVTTTLWRLLLGSACVVAGLLIVRDPGTARSLVSWGRAEEPPHPSDDPTATRDRTDGDTDGRARAVGGLLFLVGVMLLLGRDLL